MKSVSIDQITAKNPEVISLKQKYETTITEVLPPDSAKPTSLVFASDKHLFLIALEKKAQAFILSESAYQEVQHAIPANVSIWTTKNIQQAMSSVLQLFDNKRAFLAPGIHPTAFVHPLAQVSEMAHIGAFSVIEAYAVVGAHSVIYPHVYVGHYCEIGQRCHIASHVSIGSDGFGFFTDKTFTHHKIPQIGRVIIEDDCELGSHCAIDRATLTETRLKKGSKLDNFCHIAHNVQVGKNALLAAGFMVAGSTVIGNNLTASGGVHTNGHINITDNVVLSARAGVTANIEESGVYGGFPLEPHRESIKTLVSIPQIKKIRKQVNKILKHLNLNNEE